MDIAQSTTAESQPVANPLAGNITIIIPAYNEEEAIGDVVRRLAARYPDYQILVVDDGSTDGTAAALQGLPCRVVTHEINKGYGAGWKSGCRSATTDFILYYDGDGQFDPEDVGRMAALAQKSRADMVSGHRQKNSHTPLLRQPGKLVLKHLANYLARRNIEDLNCGLRLFRREVLLRYLHLLPDGFSASTTSMMIFLKRKYNVTFLSVVTTRRLGKSSVRIISDGINTVMLMTRLIALFDPLRIFMPIAGVLISVSVVYSLLEAIGSGKGVPVLGATLFTGGLITFLMGILCDQISALRLERFEDR
jgi:glycosyltransferase involved in cell wall biosynthesis